MTSTLATFPFGTESFGASLPRAPSVVVITAPLGTVTTDHVTVTWTFASPVGRTQDHATVELLDGSGFRLRIETVIGAMFSHEIGYTLSPNTNYRVRVIGFPFSAASVDNGVDEVLFSTADFAVTDPATLINDAVGSVYEIAIQGRGLMLADNPDNADQQVQRRTIQLEAPRLATGETPFSEAIERYSFIGFTDWSGGEGQRYRDLERSNPARYWQSRNVDPFEPGQISLVLDAEQHTVSGYGNQLAVVAANSAEERTLYVLTNTNTLTAQDDPAATATTFSPLAAGTVISMAADGVHWYATNGAAIRRNNTAADSGVNWSTVNVTEIAWCTDRLAGLDTVASPQNFTTFADDGTEEVTDGRFSFPNATLKGLCGGDGYVWWGVNRGIAGEVRAWQVDSDPSISFTGLTLPSSESVETLYFYLGNVMVATRDVSADTIKVYRCAPSSGRLTPSLVVELPDASDRARMSFAGMDRFVAFSWSDAVHGDERQATIGVLDLQSGGYCRYLWLGPSSSSPSPTIGAVFAWFGSFGATLNGQGIYGAMENPEYVDDGYLETSVSDLASSLDKHLDGIKVGFHELTGTIAVGHSVTSNFTFITDGTATTAGSTSAAFDVSATAMSFGFRVDLTANDDNTRTPVVTMLQAKLHASGPSDQLIIYPINCADRIVGLNGVEIEPDAGPGAGYERARWLEALVGNDVTVQGIDWPITRTAEAWEVVGVDASSVGVFNRHVNRRSDAPVLMLTLRRQMI